MTDERPDAPEGGLPGKQGEFAISLPWAARLGLAAAIGAALGLAAASVIPARGVGQTSAWIIVAAGAIAATYLSIRRVHGWHVSTFMDGTIVGLVAAPLFAILLFARAALVWEGGFAPGSVGQGLQVALYFVLFGALVTVPCGWLAGFAYHVVLSAAERARRGEDESA